MFGLDGKKSPLEQVIARFERLDKSFEKVSWTTGSMRPRDRAQAMAEIRRLVGDLQTDAGAIDRLPSCEAPPTDIDDRVLDAVG